MSMVPVRPTGSAFGEIRYATDPSPWPFVEDVKPIHGDWVATLHVQSRSTVIETVPPPPADPKEVVGDETLA
jgi:hypothetical protein